MQLYDFLVCLIVLSRMDGYVSCPSGRCNKSKRSNKFVVPLAVALGSASFILLAAIIFWRLKWRKQQGAHQISFKHVCLFVCLFFFIHKMTHEIWLKAVGKVDANRRNGIQEFKSQQYSYSEILKITHNFEKVLGKGGFGTVYHGCTDDGTEVAVKVLSESSIQGYNEFQTEVSTFSAV